MSVTRDDLEAMIAELRNSIEDPRAGIYGPDSIVWEVQREVVLFLGGGKATLLQLAHPWVAHGVDQHSATRADPLGRFQRTFYNVFGMIFGDQDRAFGAARRVHTIHSRVRGEVTEDVGAFRQGSRYEANDQDALLWVHATLVETAVQIYDLVVRPLTFAEKERYYEESKRFARLFGISDATLPKTWTEFMAYYERMLESNVIRAGFPARDIARFLFRSPHPAAAPLFAWLRVMTAGLLPDRLRSEFGLTFGVTERALYRASIAALRVGYPTLPSRVRFVPPYLDAQRRLKGLEGPDRVGQVLLKLAGMDKPHRATPVRPNGARVRSASALRI